MLGSIFFYKSIANPYGCFHKIKLQYSQLHTRARAQYVMYYQKKRLTQRVMIIDAYEPKATEKFTFWKIENATC